jgi:hypothetical protein
MEESKTNSLITKPCSYSDGQKFAIKQKGPDYMFKCKRSKLYLTV